MGPLSNIYVLVLRTHHRHQQDLQNTVLEDHGPNQSIPRKKRVYEYKRQRKRGGDGGEEAAKTTCCFFLHCVVLLLSCLKCFSTILNVYTLVLCLALFYVECVNFAATLSWRNVVLFPHMLHPLYMAEMTTQYQLTWQMQQEIQIYTIMGIPIKHY